VLIQYEAAGDQPGRIVHVVGVYQPKLEQLMRDRGVTFIRYEGRPSFDPLGRGYVLDGELVERPLMEAALDRASIVGNGTDMATLAGLPIPCTVSINGEASTVEDGILEFTSAMAGTYDLVAEAWPCLPWRATIIVTAP
jgi:hypothetical protein